MVLVHRLGVGVVEELRVAHRLLALQLSTLGPSKQVICVVAAQVGGGGDLTGGAG